MRSSPSFSIYYSWSFMRCRLGLGAPISPSVNVGGQTGSQGTTPRTVMRSRVVEHTCDVLIAVYPANSEHAIILGVLYRTVVRVPKVLPVWGGPAGLGPHCHQSCPLSPAVGKFFPPSQTVPGAQNSNSATDINSFKQSFQKTNGSIWASRFSQRLSLPVYVFRGLQPQVN